MESIYERGKKRANRMDDGFRFPVRRPYRCSGIGMEWARPSDFV